MSQPASCPVRARVADGEVVAPAHVPAPHLDERPGVVGGTAAVRYREIVVVEVARRRHEAERVPDPGRRGRVGIRAVGHVDVEDRHLARFEHEVPSLALVELVLVEGLGDRHPVAVVAEVAPDLACRVGAGDDPKAAVLHRAVGDRDPDRGGREGLDRPVPAVPVPGHPAVEAGRLVEQGRAPEDEVGTDELLHHVEERREGRDLDPGGVALHVLNAGARHVGGSNRLVAHVGVVGDEPVGEGLEEREPVRREPELGNQDPVLAKSGDLRFGQDAHSRFPLCVRIEAPR